MLTKITKYKEEFNSDITRKRLRFGMYIAIIEFLVLPLLIYIDIRMVGSSSIIYMIRLFPVVGAIPFLILYFFKTQQSYRRIAIAYGLCMFANTLMMLFLLDYYLYSSYLQSIIIGLIIVSFIIFFYAFSGIKFFAIVVIIPFILFMIFIIVYREVPDYILVTFINPVIILLVLGVSIEYLYSLRYKELINRLDLEDSHKIIQKKNLIFEEELSIAYLFMNSLLPSIPKNYKRLKLSVLYKPMMEIGGDMYEFITDRDSNEMGIILSDVTGHGVAAAIMSSMFKTLISMSGADRLNPASLLTNINKKICKISETHFVTAFAAVINQEAMTITFSNGGHCMPLLLRGDEVIPLYTKGRMLGITEESVFGNLTVDLEKNDRLLFYTDGLIESRNSENKLFNSMMTDFMQSIGSMDLDIFLGKLYEEAIRFSENNRLEDDICLIGVDIL